MYWLPLTKHIPRTYVPQYLNHVPRYLCSPALMFPVFFTLVVVISINCLQTYFSGTIAGYV